MPQAIQEAAAPVTPLGMSPAHAAHYREWRGLIEGHVRDFEKPSDTGEGGITEESKAEEARVADSLAVIDGIAEKILAEPVQTWGDLLPCAEVVFWFQWPGIDPRGAHASTEMKAGPMNGGEAINQAVSKLLKGIFTLAGIGQFAVNAHADISGGQP